MLKLVYFFILASLLTFNITAKDNDIKYLKHTETQVPARAADVDLFFENWESGIGNWVSVDETAIPPQWYLDTWMAFGGSGQSWHMGDPALGNNGGYNNGWYQVLDTDAFTVSGTNPQLKFYHRYSVEAPGGEPAPYNGWDGMNVRISTNGGTSWTVLTNPTPAYTRSSLYSFGFQHNEGPNIPGWVGDQLSWTQVTFDLSAYAGQSVRIRFAFASDPAFATGQNGGPLTLFGWMIDDIMVTNSAGTIYSNNGSATGVTPANNAATGADLWNVKTGTAFSGTMYADCNNASNTYVPNMQNSLTSEWIYLDPLSTQIYMDFYLQGTYSDNNTFPDVDYFGAYVQVEGEPGRRYVSNITEDPNGFNFVYSSAPGSWAAFSTSYSVGLIDLTSLKGNNVRVIFEFESDGDAPIGSALQIEDVRIWTPNLVPVELTSFTANQQENKVTLNWVTATEQNNRIFEIERKPADGKFVMIGFVDGHGTTTEEQRYTFVDEKVTAGKYIYRLKQIDYDGRFEYSDELEVNVIAPLVFKLEQNYPNPFNPSTNINYSIANSGDVRISVLNILGEEVSVLVNEFKEAGHFEVGFNAGSLPSGAYFYRIETPYFTQMKKMLLMK